MSDMEKELLKVTGEKDQGGREDRQDFLQRIAEAAYNLQPKAWDKLERDTQEWVNAACKAVDDKEDIEDFADGGEPEPERTSRPARGGGKDADDAPRGRGRDEPDDDRRSSRGRDADDDAPRGRGSRDDKDADDDRGGRGRGRDEERDEPRGRGGRDADDDRGGRSSRGRDADDDDRSSRRGGRDEKDDGDDEPRGRSSRGGSRGDKDEGGEKDDGGGEENVSAALKNKIKGIILETPSATVDQILKKLDPKVTVSKTTVSVIRTEFRHSLKFIQDAKLLKKAIL